MWFKKSEREERGGKVRAVTALLCPLLHVPHPLPNPLLTAFSQLRTVSLGWPLEATLSVVHSITILSSCLSGVG